VCPRVVEAGARGAALLAGKAAGVFGSVDAFPPPPLTDPSPPGDHAHAPAPPGSLPLSNQPNESLLP